MENYEFDLDKKIVTTPRGIIRALAKITAQEKIYRETIVMCPPMLKLFGMLAADLNKELIKESENTHEEMPEMRRNPRCWRKV